MFNSLSTGSFLGTGTVFREASFSWRRGHFLLSQYPFFVLFHSCLRVLHAHWQCGLLARPFNPTVFSISLLIVNCFPAHHPLVPLCFFVLHALHECFQFVLALHRIRALRCL